MTQFGTYINTVRRSLQEHDRRYSLRQVAKRIGVEPGYLSKIERGQVAPPSEAATVRLAKELDEDPDVLLALGGKVSSDLQEAIRRRPQLFAQLIRELRNAPDHAVLRIVREVRDGDW
jgi:transcriptional regulator with XRE-family HTH domain